MRFIKETTYHFSKKKVDHYLFDEELSLENIKDLLHSFSKMGIIIDCVVVREFGDYEDGPEVIRYKPSVIDEVTDDFAGKYIESYDLLGSYEERQIIVNIYNTSKRMKISYDNRDEKEINEISRYLLEQEKNDNQGTSKSGV